MLTPNRTKLVVGVALAALLWFWRPAWRVVAPALSLFVGLAAPLAVRAVTTVALAALPMIGLVVLRRRFWCRWLCPVGLISETCGKYGRARAGRFPWPVGKAAALATFAGAALGYPVFLWMDPLAIFGGFVNMASLVSAVGLPLVVGVSFLFPGAWCARICPLGATQELLYWPRARANGGRRAFLALGAGAAAAAVVPKAWARREPPLRPPGSVAETAFKGSCIRCGSCARACPTGIIEPSLEWGDPAGLLAPRLRFEGPNYCLQDCNACGQVCPTGVIRALPLEEKNRQTIGIAVVDRENCLLAEERECGVCIPRCPRAAIIDAFQYDVYQTVIQVIEEKCNGCGACVGVCPPKVIRIVPQVAGSAGRQRGNAL